MRYSSAGDFVYSEKGGEKTDYLSLQGKPVAELKLSGSTTTTHLHSDLLGSPRKATNDGDAVLGDEHYDPYGVKLNGVSDKIGYTGHVHDAETGYTYMQARFYDAQVRRFLSKDPIHFVDDNPFTFNRYSYVNNNPYRYTDPSGMCTGTKICTRNGESVGIAGNGFTITYNASSYGPSEAGGGSK